MNLILPPGMQSQLRPFATAATDELLKELHARGLLHELSGSIAIPKDTPIQMRDTTIQMQLAELYRQMGVVIGQSGLSFSTLTSTAVQEEIVAKVIICRHPAAPPQVQQAQAAQLPQLVPPQSGTSLPSGGSSEPGQAYGTSKAVPAPVGEQRSSTKKAK